MKVDLYDGMWVVEVYETEYLIIGNKDDGYDVCFNNTSCSSVEDVLFSSYDFEECLVSVYNS